MVYRPAAKEARLFVPLLCLCGSGGSAAHLLRQPPSGVGLSPTIEDSSFSIARLRWALLKRLSARAWQREAIRSGSLRSACLASRRLAVGKRPEGAAHGALRWAAGVVKTCASCDDATWRPTRAVASVAAIA